MKLHSLTINNFKGIKSLTLNFGGESAAILGNNGTGKTTIYDAFLFLLFGKDSRGAANFSIKPIQDGQPVHNVETSVEAMIFHNSIPMTMKRVYREVWSRRRGDAEDTFTGHETIYYVDNLPVAQNKYKATVESIMPESLFRALTNPFYFPETMKWQDRRTQLFKLFGELTDADVAATDEAFTDLLRQCGRYSVEEYMAGLKVKIRNFNQTLKELPARMDEVARQIIEDDDEAPVEAVIDSLTREMQELKAAMGSQDDQELLAQKAAIETEILQLQHQNDSHKDRVRAENAERNRKAMNDLADQLAALGIPELQATVALESRTEESLAGKLVDLRARFAQVASETYTAQDKCPACRRPFPAEDLDLAKQAWEAHRKERLDAINAEGRELSAKHKASKKAASEASEELSRRMKIRAEYEEAMQTLRTETIAPDMDGYTERMNQLTEKRSAILETITKARECAADKVAHIAETMAGKRMEYVKAKEQLTAARSSIAARARLEELRAQQAEVVKALESAEEAVATCEEFVRARISMVEKSINRHFDLVRWQLYREQINGGIEEICEASVNGVPYHDLNGAMRINAGLDIIYACARVTGQMAPIFVDNAESVTDLFVTDDAQVIRLVVSESDQQLRLQK